MIDNKDTTVSPRLTVTSWRDADFEICMNVGDGGDRSEYLKLARAEILYAALGAHLHRFKEGGLDERLQNTSS